MGAWEEADVEQIIYLFIHLFTYLFIYLLNILKNEMKCNFSVMLVVIYSVSRGRAVTNVGRTCSPTPLFVL